jgi:hypothetical protein
MALYIYIVQEPEFFSLISLERVRVLSINYTTTSAVVHITYNG